MTKIENAGRLMIPHILLFSLLILNVVALPFLPTAAMKPQLVLMAVYYWAIYRPTLLPTLFCFVLGLVMDVLSGMPPGVYAFIFVFVHWLVREQRRFLMGQPYSVIWAIFGVVALAAIFIQWVLYGLASMQWGSFWPIITGGAMSLFLFPLVTFLLVMTHRLLPAVSRP